MNALEFLIAAKAAKKALMGRKVRSLVTGHEGTIFDGDLHWSGNNVDYGLHMSSKDGNEHGLHLNQLEFLDGQPPLPPELSGKLPPALPGK